MKGIISSFQRYEIKYFLTPEQREKLMPKLEEHFSVDEHGRHTISNLYYDTENFEIIRDSIEKPIYKEKLRLRAYGIPDRETGQVFLELKKKYNHIVYKRRIAAPLSDMQKFLEGGPEPPGTDIQIAHEIRHFLDMHHPEPRIYLSYERVAMFGKEDPELRITMDQNLLWRDTDLDLCLGPYGAYILPEEMTLMEIKVPGTMPLWLAHELSRDGAYHSSFSKVGTCYKDNLLPKYFSNKVVTEYV